MLFQVLLNIIVFLIKCIVWIAFVLAAIPFGIYMLLLEFFPVFTQDAGFWFWSVFSISSIIRFYRALETYSVDRGNFTNIRIGDGIKNNFYKQKTLTQN